MVLRTAMSETSEIKKLLRIRAGHRSYGSKLIGDLDTCLQDEISGTEELGERLKCLQTCISE